MTATQRCLIRQTLAHLTTCGGASPAPAAAAAVGEVPDASGGADATLPATGIAPGAGGGPSVR